MEQGEIQIENQIQQNSQQLQTNNDRKFKKHTKVNKSRDLVSMLKANPTRLKYLRDSLKSFTLIKKNIYVDRKRKQPKNDQLESCLCIPEIDQNKINEHVNVSYNCIQRCLNKMISTECDDETCRCGQLCQNRKFQKHQYACIYPFPAGGKGWGLCAGEKIKKGQFIMQYIGEICSINSQEGKRRVKEYSSSTCTYLMKTSKGEVIDPTYKGNLARFINHSCQPNCITQKWNVLGQICIGIFALRDLEQNQQLTFDYQFDVFNTPLTKCLCGAKRCKGYLGLRPTDITAEQWDERLQGMTCQICNKNYDDDDLKLIICDDCNLGFHIYCINPPRQEIPQQAFYCQLCIDEKQRQKQKLEKEQREILKQRKKKILREERIRLNNQQEEDGLPTTQNYERMFQFLKKQQSIATQQLYFQDQQIQEQIVITKKQVEQPPITTTPEKPKQIVLKTQTPRKKDQVSNVYSKAVDKFQVYLNKHNKLLHQLNNFRIDKNLQIKRIILMNKIQMHLVRSNFILFEKIGATIFWDHNAKNFNDIFLKNIQLAVMGTQNQISMFQEIINVTNQIVKQLQIQMGITEATISIPAIFLKKFIGPGHYLINQMQKNFLVSIFYHRRFINDECYTIQVQTKLLIKGAKDNILRAFQQIKRRINTFQIQRVFLNPYQIKTILNNLSSLKRKPQMAQFRINRQTPFKDVNHPFYFIQQKNKEITLIGTKLEIQKAKKQIFSFFEEPNRKQEFNFNISLFLAPFAFKVHLLNIKQALQKQVPNIKMMIFDPTPPRKNMTISFLGNRDNRQRAREFLVKKLQYLNRQGKINQNFESFQDQMNFQMTKYYFKYMQNTLLTKDTAFMKGWDILNDYFCQEEDNYIWKSIRKSLFNDHQTLLYACFVLKNKIISKILRQSGNDREIDDEVYDLIKQNMARIINVHQVNNTLSLKNYNSMFDKNEVRRLFKDNYHYINFVKDDQKDTLMREQKHFYKEEIKPKQFIQQNKIQRSISRSRSREKQRFTSLFERTILKKNKNLIAILDDEQKIRMKQRAKRKLA